MNDARMGLAESSGKRRAARLKKRAKKEAAL
jgi:hypothetical protein